MCLLALATVTRRRAADRRAGRRDLLPRRVPLRLGARLGALPPHPRAPAGERDAPAGRGARGHRARPRRAGRRRAPEDAGFRQALLDIYVPRYGAEWEQDSSTPARSTRGIDAERMFAFHMDALIRGWTRSRRKRYVPRRERPGFRAQGAPSRDVGVGRLPVDGRDVPAAAGAAARRGVRHRPGDARARRRRRHRQRVDPRGAGAAPRSRRAT